MNRCNLISMLTVALLPGVVRAEEFTIVALPDTQFYSQDYPETYVAQTEWVVDSAAERNIKFVTHLGDIVNEGATLYQWDNAAVAMAILDDADMPYGTCVGNHDILYPGDYYDPFGTNYLNYFGPHYYHDDAWFGGSSPSGLSNYQIINADDREWLFLHLLVETPATELAWAQAVLNENRDKPTWVSTHRYLFDWYILGAGRYQDWNYIFEPPYREDGIKADDFFQNFVAVNRQIYLVHCGHNDGEHRQVSTNNFGLPVHEVLADYQDTYGNGGNGWLRNCLFRPADKIIDVETYSPTLNAYLQEEGDFSLGVDFEQYVSTNPLLRFQQSVGGYTGTVDTWVNDDQRNASYGSDTFLVVDDDAANSWFGEYPGQGLVRFEAIFQDAVFEGDPAPTHIPYGSTILAATLTLNLRDDTQLGNPEFYLYRMTRDWSGSSTWNSLSGGIVVGEDTAPELLDLFYGDNNPDFDYTRTANVASAVQSWSSGSTNHGIAILPQAVSFNDDGIEIRSSEEADSILRPSLDVEFTYTPVNVPPTITQYLTAESIVVNEGSEVKLTFAAQDPNPLDPLVFFLNGVEVGYVTGAGSVNHYLLLEDDGAYNFVGEVLDDEATVPAGNVWVAAINLPPVLISLTPDRTVDQDRVFLYAATASDPGPLDSISYAWDLDDDGQLDDSSAGSGEWWLSDSGLRSLWVEVTDDDGGATLGEVVATVDDLPADGDFKSDGRLELDDFAAFQDCVAGPNSSPHPLTPYTTANCLSAFDFDEDQDVDLHDFAEFQIAFAD